MSTAKRPLVVSLNSIPAAGNPSAKPATEGPIYLETNGYVLRSLIPSDASEQMLEWFKEPEMLRGLNLGGLGFDITKLQNMIAAFDNRNHFFIGIFRAGENRPIGFYTININPTHKTGNLTTGVGEAGISGRDVMWATSDALIDHFFDAGTVEKFTASVLATNYRMMFVMWGSPRFALEARHRHECRMPSGERVDLLIFAAFKTPPPDWQVRKD